MKVAFVNDQLYREVRKETSPTGLERTVLANRETGQEIYLDRLLKMNPYAEVRDI